MGGGRSFQILADAYLKQPPAQVNVILGIHNTRLISLSDYIFFLIIEFIDQISSEQYDRKHAYLSVQLLDISNCLL